MTPPKIDSYDNAIARAAWGSKHCSGCGGRKLRDIETLCSNCVAKLPEAMRRNLRDKTLYAVTYIAALKRLRPQP